MSDGVLDLNLIHLFTFYLAAVFTVSTVRRLRQYHAVAQLAVAAPNRWPRVLQQLRGHWFMFLTWATLRGRIPSDTFERVTELLREQLRCATEWRDQVNTYFWRKSGVPDAEPSR